MSDDEFNRRLNEADKVVHKVEDQWHYERMTRFGFVSLDKTGVGFSRTYRYEHPKTKHRIGVTTGINADYWKDKTGKGFGYHADLEPHLKTLEL